MSKCKYCGKDITWMREGRKSTPVDSDGTPHHCEEMQKSRDSLKSVDRTAISPEELAKYEQAINTKVQDSKKKPL
jgi:hypothetical protein